MTNIQTVLDALIEKGVVNREELGKRSWDVTEQLKPRNFLTEEELKQVQATLDSIKIPAPTGWAHAMMIGSLKETKNGFSPDRVYCSCCLGNLSSALYQAGLQSSVIFRKLKNAENTAERYGFNNCIF